MKTVKFQLWTTIFTIGFLINQSSSQLNQIPKQETPRTRISQWSEKFAFQLLKTISSETSAIGYDVIISPFTVWSLLLMTAEGAGGNTLEQLKQTLNVGDLDVRTEYKDVQSALNVNTSKIELDVNQAFFFDKNRQINDDYGKKLIKFYDTKVQATNFQDVVEAEITINNYVNQTTHGKIPNILRAEELINAQMILITAVFFKGQWMYPFDRKLTKIEPFYGENGIVLGNVNMMYQKIAAPYSLIPDLNSHAIELPYGNEGELSIIIILPKIGTPLQSVITKLSDIGFQTIKQQLNQAATDYEDEEVELYLPRVSITADLTLNYALELMGLMDVFDASLADLKGMTKANTYLSRIMHKAKLEINEEGTTATAASGAAFVNKITPPSFYANRPFAYFIFEKTTGVVLFCGEIRNPKRFSRDTN